MTSSIKWLDQPDTWQTYMEEREGTSPFCSLSYNFLSPLAMEGTPSFISNIQTKLAALIVDQHLLPVTINQREYTNSYTCSPYTHYISYAKEELWELQSPLLEKILAPFLTLLGQILKRGRINRVVIINNWLLSTNLYPALSHDQLAKITSLLCKRFPNHAILFRSVTDYTPPQLYHHLTELRYTAIPSRQIYFYDPSQWHRLNSKQRNLLKREARFLHNSGYEVLTKEVWSEADLTTMIQLYQQLYIDKYSTLNPQLTTRWLRLAIESGWLHVGVLVKAGQMDGVYGYILQDETMTTPFLGYRTDLPQKIGLYRLLSQMLVKEATEHRWLQHQSSGAAQFKRDRGAFAQLEYTMVYTRHLPLLQQQTWILLRNLLKNIAVPLMELKKL